MLLPKLQQLEQLRASIKSEWKKLLRQEPAATALANPDTLAYLMDSTLDQLFAGLRQPNEKWLRDIARSRRPLRESCSCHLSPLIVYFSTGELALHAVASRSHAGDLPEISLLFHAIAHEEINALCSVCMRRDGPGCLSRPPESENQRLAATSAVRGNLARHTVGDSPVTRRNTRLNCDRDWNPTS